MHQHSVQSRTDVSPPSAEYDQHGNVADSGNHHQNAVRDYGNDVAFVECHIQWQANLVRNIRRLDSQLPVIVPVDFLRLVDHPQTNICISVLGI